VGQGECVRYVPHSSACHLIPAHVLCALTSKRRCTPMRIEPTSNNISAHRHVSVHLRTLRLLLTRALVAVADRQCSSACRHCCCSVRSRLLGSCSTHSPSAHLALPLSLSLLISRARSPLHLVVLAAHRCCDQVSRAVRSRVGSRGKVRLSVAKQQQQATTTTTTTTTTTPAPWCQRCFVIRGTTTDADNVCSNDCLDSEVPRQRPIPHALRAPRGHSNRDQKSVSNTLLIKLFLLFNSVIECIRILQRPAP
jgi:hypothetical protein